MSVADPIVRTLGWMLLASGVGIAVWALLGDAIRRRFRKRRRCPKCWYDLSHTAGLRCNECGHEASRERALFRAQRRWSLALIGTLVAVVGFALDASTKASANGWVAGVPTTAIILAMPWLPEQPPTVVAGPGTLSGELVNDLVARRIPDGDLWRWQISMLIGRAARGDSRRPLLGEDWTRFYAPILGAIAVSGYLDDTRDQALIVKSASIANPVLQTRTAWPAGADVWAYAIVRRWGSSVWYAYDATTRKRGFEDISITPTDSASVLHRYGYSTRWIDYRIRLGPTRDAAGFDDVKYRGTIRRGPLWTIEDEADVESIDIRRTSVKVRWRVADRVTDILTANRDPRVGRALAKDGVMSVETSKDELLLYLPLRLVKPLQDWMDAHDGVVAVRIEVRHHDEVVARGEAWWGTAPRVGPMAATSSDNVLIPRGELITLQSDEPQRLRDALVRERDPASGEWTVHFTGDPMIALRHFSAKTYWSGTTTATLRGM